MMDKPRYRLKASILAIALLSSLVSGCRYLELYDFSKQFCRFDEYLSITPGHTGTIVDFHTPTLKRSLLLRYLGSSPHEVIRKEHGTPAIGDNFLLQNVSDTRKARFKASIRYHLLDEHSLLASAQLDPGLSEVFKPQLIRLITQSFCTDDYSLGTKRLVFRFELDSVKASLLPSLAEVRSTFGVPAFEQINKLDRSQRLGHKLSFIDQSDSLQEKEMSISFDFGPHKVLNQIQINYFKYDYQLDLGSGSGRLIVTRNK